MRAMAIERYGDPTEMRPMELDAPLVGPDSVLIRVAAAGVNPVDTKIRQGALTGAIPHFLPVIPGWDAAGTVEAVGPAVVEFDVGDPVLAYCRKDLVQGGTYAELVSVRVSHVASAGAMDLVDAGALPLAGLTAYQCLHDAIAVQPGDTVAVRGAAGGVGHFAVQIARAAGARVIAIAGPGAEPFVRGLGADEFVDYRAGGVAQALRELLPDGVDALVDTVGGDGLGELVPAVREGGRIASIMAAQPPPAAAERDIGFRYIFVRPHAGQLAALVGLAEAGELRVETAERIPLEQAARAHERMEAGGIRGKLVLTV